MILDEATLRRNSYLLSDAPRQRRQLLYFLEHAAAHIERQTAWDEKTKIKALRTIRGIIEQYEEEYQLKPYARGPSVLAGSSRRLPRLPSLDDYDRSLSDDE